jgi:hypothetical protein
MHFFPGLSMMSLGFLRLFSRHSAVPKLIRKKRVFVVSVGGRAKMSEQPRNYGQYIGVFRSDQVGQMQLEVPLAECIEWVQRELVLMEEFYREDPDEELARDIRLQRAILAHLRRIPPEVPPPNAPLAELLEFMEHELAVAQKLQRELLARACDSAATDKRMLLIMDVIERLRNVARTEELVTAETAALREVAGQLKEASR